MRPEGFVNPWKRDIPTFEFETEGDRLDMEKEWQKRAKDWEAGADAMLEALKKDGQYCNPCSLPRYWGKKGYLVFIPEETHTVGGNITGVDENGLPTVVTEES